MAVSTEFITGRISIPKANVVTQFTRDAENLTGFRAQTGVVIYADIRNKGTVYVGNSGGVTADENDLTDGFPLYPGDNIEFEARVGDNNIPIFFIVDGISSSGNGPWKLWYFMC